VNFRLIKGVKILVMVIVACAVFGFVTMHLWNWLIPTIFGLTAITFWQALGLVLLGKILFGGFHRHGGGGRGWKRHMENRWAKMSEEDREKFRAGMRERNRCGFGGRGRGRYEATEVPVEKGAV
jgi:chromate transport protein ChrA